MKHHIHWVQPRLACWSLVLLWAGLPRLWPAPADFCWDRFRGPNGQGIAERARPPIEFTTSKNLKWSSPVPQAYASVVVWEDRMFLTGIEGDSVVLLRLNCRDGKTLWKQVLAGTISATNYVTDAGHRVSSTPAVDARHVIVYSYHHGLFAYDHEGRQLWNRKLPPPRTPYCPASSPVVRDDRVYLSLDGWMSETGRDGTADTNPSKLYAVHIRDGSLVWETPRALTGFGYSTPVLREFEDSGRRKEELVVFGGRRLTGYDLVSGGVNWWVGGFPYLSVSVPSLGEGMAFVGATGLYGFSSAKYEGPTWERIMSYDKNRDGRLAIEEIPSDSVVETRPELPRDDHGYVTFAIKNMAEEHDRNQDGFFSKDEFDGMVKELEAIDHPAIMAIRPKGKGDISESGVVWRATRQLPEAPSLLYYRGRLYSVKDGGIVVCYEPATGEVRYSERLGAGGAYAASPVAADGRIYFAAVKGDVTVVQAGDHFKVLARNRIGEEIYATPALVGNRIYVRTLDHVYAFAAE